MEKGIKFKYNRWFSRVILARFYRACFLGTGILILLGRITSFFSQDVSLTVEFLGSSAFIIFFIVGSFVSFSVILNAYPKMMITHKGLLIRVFTYWPKWILIEWSEIIEIRKSSKTFQHYDLWVLTLNGELSNWLRFLRKRLIGKSEPAIVISSDLERKIEFLDLLSEFINCDSVYE